MVMTSSQISQLTAQSQQMGMSQMQHAAMISQQAGYYGSGSGEAIGQDLGGRAINQMSAIGGPGLQAGMALAGVDPFSMALRGGIAGFGRAGVAGAIGGGALAGGLVALPMMAAQYGWGQMTHGMQEQQMLRGQMQQAFQFQNRFGGMGFTGGEIGDIGAQFRHTAQQRGSMGEQTSFDELGRLAQNMSRLGMAQNVRNVQQFQDEFSKMLKNVKQVAKAMSTSLEEAQEMMAGMRGAGVFRDQGRVAQQVRETAIGGGLAVSEVTGAMRMGSQISRMIGGRGRAGAQAGEQAIGLVGLAQQTGVMTEEDVYNVTGETGAAGRMAMAQTMLQSSARFMKSGLGRRFLASIAGKGGTLNEAALEEYMAGGVGTGRTMQLAGQNLAKIGRADFIRNEGRLRGQAMGAFGGLAPAIVMRGWLAERGMNVDDDRAAILMQRQLGMSTEQVQKEMDMVRSLPMMLEKRRNILGEAQYGERQRTARSHTNINRLKRQFEDARGKVQGYFRQLGANFQEEISNYAERAVSAITGDVVEAQAYDVEQIAQGFMAGGARGRIAMQRMGILREDTSKLAELGRSQWQSKVLSKQIQARGPIGTADILESVAGSVLGGVFGSALTKRMFSRGAGQNAFGQYMGTMEAGMRRSGDWERFQQAGWGLSAELGNESLMRHIRDVRETSAAFTSGARTSTQWGDEMSISDAFSASRRASQELYEQIGMGGLQGAGRNRIEAFKAMVARSNDPSMKIIASEIAGKNDREVARVMGRTMRAAGLYKSESALMAAPDLQALFRSDRGFGTELDRHKAIGEAVFGRVGRTEQRLVDAGGGGRPRMTGPEDKGFMLSSSRGEARYESRFVAGMTDRQKEAAARIMDSQEWLETARSAVSDDAKVRNALIKRLGRAQSERLASVSGNVAKMDDATMAQFQADRAAMAAAMFRNLEAQPGGATEEAIEAAANSKNMTAQEFKDLAAGAMARVGEQERAERVAAVQRIAEIGREKQERLIVGGMITDQGQLTGIARERLSKIGAQTGTVRREIGGSTRVSPRESLGVMIAQSIAKQQELAAQLEEEFDPTTGTFTEKGMAISRRIQKMERRRERRMGKLTAGQREELGQYLITGGAEDEGRETLERAGVEKAFGKAGRTQTGAAGVIASQLGIKQLSKEELQGSSEDIANTMVGKLGLNLSATQSSELRKQIQTGLAQAQKGEGFEAAGSVVEARKIAATGLRAKREEEQNEIAAQQDPNFRMLRDMNKSLADLPNKIADAIAGKDLKAKVTGHVSTDKPGEQAPEDPKKKCFPGNVQVAMADNTTKPIEEVKIGDRVLSFTFEMMAVVETTVVSLFCHELQTDIVEINGVPVTTNHPIYSEGWKTANEMRLGSPLLYLNSVKDGVRQDELQSLCRVTREARKGTLVYNIEVDKHGNYFAGGLLVSQDC